MPYPDTQVNQTLYTNCTRHDNLFWLTSRDENENLRQSRHMVPWKRLLHFKHTKCHIGPIRWIPFYIRTFWLARSGQLSPALERPDLPIQVYCLFFFKKSLRTSPTCEQPHWLVQTEDITLFGLFKTFFSIKTIGLVSLSWFSDISGSGWELLYFWVVWLEHSKLIISYSRFSLKTFIHFKNIIGPIYLRICTSIKRHHWLLVQELFPAWVIWLARLRWLSYLPESYW